MKNTNIPSSLRILCVGNSFAWDTMWHLPGIARAAGVRELKLAFLYVFRSVECDGLHLDLLSSVYRKLDSDRAAHYRIALCVHINSHIVEALFLIISLDDIS